jgi:hypothetical protein
MDDSSARWIAANVSARSVLRLEKRDRAGQLLWSGEWTYRGSYVFTAAVTPGGEPLFAATAECQGTDPTCGASIDVAGVTHAGSTVVRLGSDGSVQWARSLSGWLLGADADGGTALGWSKGSTPPTRLILKLNAYGGIVWSREITSLLSLGLARTGDVLATGCYEGDQFLLVGIACKDGVVATQLASDGTPRWTAHVDGYWPTIDSTADGSEYAAARGGNPFVLTSLSPSGTTRWSRQFGSAFFANQRGEGLVIAAAANGPVAVAGYTYTKDASGALNSTLAILGFDGAGNPTFTITLPGVLPAVAMVYGAEGALLVAAPGSSLDAPGGHVAGAMVVELAP